MDPPVKRIFVLGGGGGRGACQVGMLRALIEADMTADAVVGVSVGALNGAVYAQRPTLDAVESLARLWATLDKDALFPRRRFGNTWRYAQKGTSVFPAQGLLHLIQEHVKVFDLTETEIPLHVLAAKYSNGAEVWFDHGPPAVALYASAALPGVFPPLVVDGEALVDGGIVDDAPIGHAIELGASEIYMLLCGTSYVHLPPPQRPLEALMRTVAHTKASRFRAEVARIPVGTKFILLDCPEASGVEALDFTKKDELLDAGYVRAKAILRGEIVVDPLSEPAQEASPAAAPPLILRASPLEAYEAPPRRGPCY